MSITDIVVILVIIFIIIGIVLFYPRLRTERKIGFAEGIEDELASIAFSNMQRIPPFKLIRRKIIKHAFLAKKRCPSSNTYQLLDFGCGTGHLLIDLYRKSQLKKINVKLHGLDISMVMVEKCRSNLSKHQIKNVSIVKGDGDSCPYPNDFFSVIITSLSLHHWGNPVAVFSEIYRILEPGGYLILFDLYRDVRRFWYFFMKFITRIIAPKPLKRINEPLGSLLAAYTIEEIEEILKKSPWNKHQLNITGFGPMKLIEIRK